MNGTNAMSHNMDIEMIAVLFSTMDSPVPRRHETLTARCAPRSQSFERLVFYQETEKKRGGRVCHQYRDVGGQTPISPASKFTYLPLMRTSLQSRAGEGKTINVNCGPIIELDNLEYLILNELMASKVYKLNYGCCYV